MLLQLLQTFLDLLGLQHQVNMGDFWGIFGLFVLAIASASRLLHRKEEPSTTHGRDWKNRLSLGLERSRREVWGKLTDLFSSHQEREKVLEDIEELLYSADLGPGVVAELLKQLRQELDSNPHFSQGDFQNFLFDFLHRAMSPVQEKVDPLLYQFVPEHRGETKVIMVVGVNGAGKTTTIGKLAIKLTRQGADVLVGACDTFRAAAVDQLQVWCDRAGATMVRANEGAAPSGVMHESLQRALREKVDYCILDTAGRLHTKGNLMEELTKCKNVLKKLSAQAPHSVLLVIDAITGQNAIEQAQQFDQHLGVTGIILTKCDGSSKAGSVVGIVQKLQKPITHIGVGEGVDDLDIFRLDDYLHTLLGIKGH